MDTTMSSLERDRIDVLGQDSIERGFHETKQKSEGQHSHHYLLRIDRLLRRIAVHRVKQRPFHPHLQTTKVPRKVQRKGWDSDVPFNDLG